ncbi:UDP-N-acetylmuramate dehydrogenase [Hwanghaeella sp. 1Z406]|jgi:UDP-N-acetylmuramate dehydrogenase|uniref:UDP-N-acetylmuramate dehydrogenase n=1 Tax=Hwanghaeella sp. 1Z406 TaxID=3402811 RepID=UPI0026B339A6|tara:strand:- start:55458 stop:56390 length:933 start_codon:yes stop_codon:yes gene_type:complete
MMMALRTDPFGDDLISRLPSTTGRLSEGSLLSKVTWFRVGGPAEVLYKPADQSDLQTFLAALPKDIPVTPIGVGSNLLVRDGGVAGIVLRLGGAFADITVEGNEIEVGAAALDANIAKTAANAGLTGLEFYSGIPGTIGGALRMNAGAYGTETKDVLIWAEALDRSGTLHRLSADEMGFSYRHSSIDDDWIFVRARYRASPGDKTEILAKMAEIQENRSASQPIRSRTGGSTFRNPPNGKAWQTIDAAGCRGLVWGGAMVSEQHCNFLINTGTATAADLEGLGEEVRRRVKDSQGIDLTWEIKRIGRTAS